MTLGQFNDTQNKEIVSFVQDKLMLNPITDSIPRQVVPTIQPTLEVNNKVCNYLRTASVVTGSLTGLILTTPSDRDFYLTAATLTLCKDANATLTQAVINVVINGAQYNPLRIGSLTLTAHQAEMTISFPVPIKLDRNSAINVSVNTNVGNFIVSGVIAGYTELSGNNLSV